jgi:hypothetical protein
VMDRAIQPEPAHKSRKPKGIDQGRTAVTCLDSFSQS